MSADERRITIMHWFCANPPDVVPPRERELDPETMARVDELLRQDRHGFRKALTISLRQRPPREGDPR